MEDGQNVLYYTLQNSKIYREKELIGMQIHDNVSNHSPLIMCAISSLIGCSCCKVPP